LYFHNALPRYASMVGTQSKWFTKICVFNGLALWVVIPIIAYQFIYSFRGEVGGSNDDMLLLGYFLLLPFLHLTVFAIASIIELMLS
jgi:hypothetical protein